MKMKLILTLVVGVFVSHIALAQGNKSGRGREKILEYKTELGLSDAQVEKIRAVNAKYAPQMKEIRKTEPIDKKAIKKLNEARKAEIEQILTPEQIKKWEAIVEKRKTEYKDSLERKD